MKLFINIETGEIIAATECPVLTYRNVHHIILHDGRIVEIVAHRQDEYINPVVLQRLGVYCIK